ncbi:MAG TPA: aminodeoxychorismate lyase [Gammaproteobacteria bacterium]|nr:aminodeoxychorismate lyase [Gammaproteobacteria bacterium]
MTLSNPSVLVNGHPCEALDPVLPVADRGFQYGDGVFETIASRGSRLLDGDAHLSRLAAGARLLGIPEPDTRRMAGEAASLLDGQGREERHVIKVLYTRGPGGRGLAPPADPRPTRVLMRLPWPEHPPTWARHGVHAITCATRQVSGEALDGRIKSMNQLNHIVARMEWSDPGIAEGLLQDAEGRLVEGTVTNLFLVSRGSLLTPDLSGSGLPGITRDRVLDIAEAEGIPARETEIRAHHLEDAEEMFLTNSVIGVWPVLQIDHRILPEAPGPLTSRLRRALEAGYA